MELTQRSRPVLCSRLRGPGPGSMGTAGGIGTATLEVKFRDRRVTDDCESICPERSRRPRTKVGGSKAIRYRPSSNLKRCRPAIRRRRRALAPRRAARPGNPSVRAPGGGWSQGRNLKELTEGHHQEWSLRPNLTQHGEPHQVRTPARLTGSHDTALSRSGGGWCMAVRGSWSDLSGSFR